MGCRTCFWSSQGLLKVPEDAMGASMHNVPQFVVSAYRLHICKAKGEPMSKPLPVKVEGPCLLKMLCLQILK